MEVFLPWMLLLLTDPAAGSTRAPVVRAPGLYASREACEVAGKVDEAGHACLQVPSDAELEAARQAFRADQETRR